MGHSVQRCANQYGLTILCPGKMTEIRKYVLLQNSTATKVLRFYGAVPICRAFFNFCSSARVFIFGNFRDFHCSECRRTKQPIIALVVVHMTDMNQSEHTECTLQFTKFTKMEGEVFKEKKWRLRVRQRHR